MIALHKAFKRIFFQNYLKFYIVLPLAVCKNIATPVFCLRIKGFFNGKFYFLFKSFSGSAIIASSNPDFPHKKSGFPISICNGTCELKNIFLSIVRRKIQIPHQKLKKKAQIFLNISQVRFIIGVSHLKAPGFLQYL